MMRQPGTYTAGPFGGNGGRTEKFDIEVDLIRFFDKERPDKPWFPAEVLMSMARQSDQFRSVEEKFDKPIPGFNQFVHQATVVDAKDRLFGRSGAATIGERLPNG